MRFPKIDEVAAALRNVNKMQLPDDADDDGEGGGIDVRLQVYPDGDWAVRWGSSDYDQDHRGYWGASSVPGDNRRFDSKALARDLIEQAKEQRATGGGDDLEEGRRTVRETDDEDDDDEEDEDERDDDGSSDPSQVEFAVDDMSGHERIFKTFNEAAGFAVSIAASNGSTVNLDVLIWSPAGARAYGGDDAVEQYFEDPEASVFERIEIRADAVGRVA